MENNIDNIEGKIDILNNISKRLYRNSDYVNVINTGIDYVIVSEERIGKKYKLIENYDDRDAFIKENPQIKIYEDRGFKFGNYIEVLISYDSMLQFNKDDFVMDSFNIEDVCVVIDQPSFLFDVIMNGFNNDKYYDSYSYHTISLKGISSENYEEYLTKALFLIGYFNSSTVDSQYPSCLEFLGEYYWKYATDEEKVEERRKNNNDFAKLKFTNIRYYEALAFYNEGMRLNGHEISFQYFYKVLEYFFLICRKEEFKNIINDYNNTNHMDDFIKKVTDIYKQDEESQLKVLLKSIQNKINGLISYSFQNGYILNSSIDDFSTQLYLYRNTIVHGKSDNRYTLKMPINLSANKENYWNMVVREIAEALINKYCFSES